MKTYRRYRFNKRKFIHNVLVPVQITIGALILFGTAGASSTGDISVVQTIIQGAVGILLMASSLIY